MCLVVGVPLLLMVGLLAMERFETMLGLDALPTAARPPVEAPNPLAALPRQSTVAADLSTWDAELRMAGTPG